MFEDLIVGWAIESNRESDYGMAWWLEIVPTAQYRFEDKKIQYNQKESDPRGCTRYWVMTAIANNRGVERVAEAFQHMRETAPSYWRAPKEGMLLSKAGDMVVDYLNSLHPDQGWTKLAISLYDEGENYMKKGYMLQVGSIVNSKYFGFTKTGLIDDIWGKEGEWHCRCLFLHTAYEAKGEVENYVGILAHNVIDISVRQKIQDIRQYYSQAFIYYQTHKNMNEITVEYNKGSTPYQQEIVHAREKIIHDGRKPLYVIYTEDDYIENMKIDIWIARSKARGDI